ncbi:MAG TPA: hypothetical protein VLK25_02485 [Allosphingosinicella sp.]|nr:hypothetical protein [Allosphingosinicella sp.]
MSTKPLARLSSAMGIAALLAGTAFLGATGVSAAPDKQGDAKDSRSRRVCRTVMPSGSRLTQRVCRTQAEWEDGRSKTQQSVLDSQMGDGTTVEQLQPPVP